MTVGRKVGATTSKGISGRLAKYCWANAYSKFEYYMGSSFENMFKSEAEVGNILIEQHGQYISGEHFKVVDIDLWKTVLTKVHSSQGNTGSLVFRGPLKYCRSDRHILGCDKLKESVVHFFIQRGWVSVEEIIESFRNGTYFL
jgi:hypothetical protein